MRIHRNAIQKTEEKQRNKRSLKANKKLCKANQNSILWRLQHYILLALNCFIHSTFRDLSIDLYKIKLVCKKSYGISLKTLNNLILNTKIVARFILHCVHITPFHSSSQRRFMSTKIKQQIHHMYIVKCTSHIR